MNLSSKPFGFITFQGVFRLLLLSSLLAVSACSRDGDVATDETIDGDKPNSFAAFINPINGLASGDYVIEVNVDSAGDAGGFTLTVSYDDGSSEEFSGNWTAAVGTRTFEITLFSAGGIDITLQSSVENNLRLLNGNNFEVAADGAAAAGDSSITIESSLIDSAAYGAAYYAAIDPNNDKDTLEKWKVSNGYYDALDAGKVVEPRFRDTKDLGYGRGMRMWTNTDGSLYFFVENFQVRTVPGEEYTTLNLEALIADSRQHHFGTNAIEFSTFPYGAGEPGDNGSTHKFAKFFTFDATKGNQRAEDHSSETRLDEVNLDGRGDKSMPGACVYCHGGTLYPLRADGSFRDNVFDGTTGLLDTAGNGVNGDTNSKLQLLDVPSFEYGGFSPYTRAEQEPIIKQVNMAIYCSYPNLKSEEIQAACAQYCVNEADTANCDGDGNSLEAIILCDDAADTVDCDGNGNDLATVLINGNTSSGQWSGTFANVMTEGWYNDTGSAGVFDRDTFNEDYVPLEWRYDSSDNMPPPGSEQLFLEVVQPVCFVCHSRRGTDLGSFDAAPLDPRQDNKDIDFSSYEKFISHAEQIKQYVYDRGVMPLSLRGYNAFWDEDSSAPEILASHLNGVLPADNQVALNSENKVDEPGVPVADAGPDRTSTSPVRLFGSNSRFVDRFSWSITSSPAGSDALLTEVNTSRPLLTTSVDGLYEIKLVAAFDTNVVTDSVFIRIDNSSIIAQDPKTITFADIRPIFSTAGPAGASDSRECDDCHSVLGVGGAPVLGVPVFWNDFDQPTGVSFYDQVIARVNFEDPENSLILTKPSNNHHYGELRGGFDLDNPDDRHNYDLILNWILEGAPES